MIYKKFSHGLKPQPIVIRESTTNDEVEKSDLIGVETGLSYPLIRIDDFTFVRKDIESFEMSIGSTIPSFSASVNDSMNRLTEDLKPKLGSIVTLFIGNPRDEMHEPVKADFYLTACRGGDGSFNINGLLYIPEMFQSPNRVFVQKTSLEVLEELAKECKLGFVTNIESTNDRMDWIQYQKTIDFIPYLAEKSFISLDTKLMIFVDQWCNLNVISIKEALKEKPSVTYLSDPRTGEKMVQDSVMTITNWNMDAESTNPNNENKPYKMLFGDYHKWDDFGEIVLSVPEKLEIEVLDINSVNTTITEFPSPHMSNLDHIIKKEKYTGFFNDNAYPEYFQSEIRNAFLDVALTGINYSVQFDFMIGGAYLYMSLIQEIWNTVHLRKSIENQDENLNADQTEANERDKPQSERVLNYDLSGDVLVTGLKFHYDGYNDSNKQAINTSFNLFLKKSNDYGKENIQN